MHVDEILSNLASGADWYLTPRRDMDPVYSVLVQFYFHFFICDQNASEPKVCKKMTLMGNILKITEDPIIFIYAL